MTSRESNFSIRTAFPGMDYSAVQSCCFLQHQAVPTRPILSIHAAEQDFRSKLQARFPWQLRSLGPCACSPKLPGASQGARQLLPELRARRRDLDSAIQDAFHVQQSFAGARELHGLAASQPRVLLCRPSKHDPGSCASAVPRQTSKIALLVPVCLSLVFRVSQASCCCIIAFHAPSL